MNINEFKEGDIITRNEPITYRHNEDADGSYTGDRIIFKGVDKKSKVIILIDDMLGLFDLSYAKDAWDEGWEYYPETLWQKAKNSLLGKSKKQQKESEVPKSNE